MSISVNSNPYVNSSYPAPNSPLTAQQKLEAVNDALQSPEKRTCDVFEDEGVYVYKLPSLEETIASMKSDNSFLLNVAAFQRVDYYTNLFRADAELANKMITDRMYNSSAQYAYSINNVYSTSAESALSRYAELREEITRAFGSDKDLLSLNVLALDESFNRVMENIARYTALHLQDERALAESYASQGIKYENHKLAMNKGFNKVEFEANAKLMIKELAQTFIAKINEGLDYAQARENAIKYASSFFNKTTSVNKLSFSDFMVAHNNSFAETRSVSRGELNRRFNNSTELSAELRALLG